MHSILRFRPVVFVLACFIPILMGCGGGTRGVKVEGQIVQDGQPYIAPSGESVHLSFAAKDATFPAKINAADGSFVVEGPAGKGIPSGKYKVMLSGSLSGTDPASLAKAATIQQRFAQVNGKEYEVTGEANQKITIDLTKGTVGK